MIDTQEKLARALYETIRPICDRPQRPDGINGRTWGDHACALTKALTAQGLAIVPLEPTDEMNREGSGVGATHPFCTTRVAKSVYKAMILSQDPNHGKVMSHET